MSSGELGSGLRRLSDAKIPILGEMQGGGPI